MARTTRTRQRSPWPLAGRLPLTAVLIPAALALGAWLDAQPITLTPAPTPGASPAPETP
jgi:hypothetical protein